jgi:hypothetical protein
VSFVVFLLSVYGLVVGSKFQVWNYMFDQPLMCGMQSLHLRIVHGSKLKMVYNVYV